MGFPVALVAQEIAKTSKDSQETWKGRVEDLFKAYTILVTGKVAPAFRYGDGVVTVKITDALVDYTGYSKTIVRAFLVSFWMLVDKGKIDPKYLNPLLTQKYSQEFGVGKVASQVQKSLGKVLTIGGIIAAGALIINHQLNKALVRKVSA